MDKITYSYLVSARLFTRTRLMFLLIVLSFVLFSWSNTIYKKTINYFVPPVTVPCNTDLPVPMTNLNHTDLTATSNTSGLCLPGCAIQNASNLVDENETNFASATTLLGLGVTHNLRVTDNTADEFYSAGSFAGFLIRNTSVLQANLLNALIIRTYLDGTLQETKSGTTLALVNSTLLGADKYYVGFYTTQNYDAIQISISSLSGVLSTTDIFHAVTNSFCAGPALECNTPTQLIKPDFPVRIVEEHTGLGGVLGVGSVSNTNNVIDSNLGNYASINLLAGVSATGSIAVKDEITEYPEMTYAAFDIENATLLNTELFDAITISTYLDGTFIESRTGTTELLPVNSGLLFPGNESVRVGFVTTAAFDEVRLTLSQLVSLNLGSTRVFGMVLESFCAGTISCDEPFVLANPNDPVIINNGRTGIDGVACVACEVDDTQNVISSDNSDYAMINVVAGVASTASISVKDVLTDYPVGTVAGFVIRDTNTLLAVDLLNSITIKTYLDNVQQEQRTATNLLALEALGLVNITPTSTDGFYVVAFPTTLSFDEVRITVAALTGAINSLEVYGAYIDATNNAFCQTADIAVIKTGVFNDGDGDSCSDVGETITYTFTVTNKGIASITNVILTDPLLGGAIALASGDTDSDNELDVDETWIYTSDYPITQIDIDAGLVANQATVTGTSTGGVDVTDLSDDNSVTEDDATETILCQTSAIALIKTGTFNDGDGDSCSDVGETITYTFTLTNEGNTSITNVVLTDPRLGGAIALASGDIDSDNELDVDEIWIYTSDYPITQTDIDAGMISNQATVTGTSTGGVDVTDLSDDNSVTEDDVTDTTLCQSEAIALIKTGTFNDGDGDGCSDVGETITYTFTLTNEGNTSITNVVLTDPMLGGAIALASGDTDSDNELDIDEIWIYTSDYAITQTDIDAGLVNNQATVTGTSSGGVDVSDLSDDDSVIEDDITQTTLCQPQAAIALIKTGVFNDENGNGCSDMDETITYTFEVTNEGNSSISNVALNDPLLGGSIALASGDTNSNNELDIAETWIYTSDYVIIQSDIDAGLVSNQATVTGASNGENLSDLSDDNSVIEDDVTVTTLCNSGSISLEKVGFFNDENGDGTTQVGETISYTFIVYNTGSVTLYDITVDDDLSGVIMSGGPIAELPPGGIDGTTFTANYIISEQDFDTMLVTNHAIVHAVDSSGNLVTDTSDDPTDLTNNDINGDGEPDDPTVTVLPGVLGDEFEIFNAVSPDGDGLNDFFKIVGIENYPNNNLQIFNRWGVLVYETDSYGINGNLFRGVSEGRVTVTKKDNLPTGAYFYILKRFISGDKTLTDEGYLYIKRN